MPQQPAFGHRLRKLRTDRGLSQSALAGDGMSTGSAADQEATAQRITTHEELKQSVLAAVALEKAGSDEPLASNGVGRSAVLPC
ncbi:hypothetical protein OG604_01060 [Streptomyces sp. NBC_01231]|nr:hypothetical protein OG604_01060 [Streptomyces sp. NBC_01231]